MIKQGTNKPITIQFQHTPEDISVTLHNEIETLKHWDMADLLTDEDELLYTAPITQEESFAWEEGPCEIEIRWEDEDGIIHKRIVRENIEWTMDSTVLNEEVQE